jgi:hypothetical protein
MILPFLKRPRGCSSRLNLHLADELADDYSFIALVAGIGIVPHP